MGLFGWGKARTAGTAGARPATPNSTHFGPSSVSAAAANPMSVRKDLLQLVLRETLARNGIPSQWIGLEMLRTSSPRHEAGLHARLLIRHWEPRIMLHGVALERDMVQRLQVLDATAQGWLMGFSWQFALDDRAACPPLPHPGSWTQPAVMAAPAIPQADPPPTAPADIIEGPVVIPRSQEDVRADLERLLATRDDDVRRHTQGEHGGFAPTQPVQL